MEHVGKPLAGRRNLVVSETLQHGTEGFEVYRSLAAALEAAYNTDPMPFLIGGRRIYEEGLPLCTHLFLTEIDTPHDGDVCFPPLTEADFESIEERYVAPLRFRIMVRRTL